jgi:orotate phosphoribosyltransferase
VPAGSSSLQAELTHSELGVALREHAYLEGDFVLRSGRRSRYYLDKYRFETRPDLLGALGERIAQAVAEHEPDAVRLAGPELGAVPLAAAASLASGLPFLIVRKEAKEYGTGNRLEGVYEEGECVCLVEDVVTSGGAAVGAVEALRGAGLTCRTAICVVDREEGGADALARVAVRLLPLFRASELLGVEKPPQKRDG